MTIDWNISAGNLIVLVAGLIGIYVSISTRLKGVETKMDAVWGWFMGQIPNVPGRSVQLADGIFMHGRRGRRKRDETETEEETEDT